MRFVAAIPRRSLRPLAPLAVQPRVADVCGSAPQVWVEQRSDLVCLPGGDCLVGKVFNAGGVDPRGFATGIPASAEACAARAAWLVANCWGAYCAILRDTRSGGLGVMPDPSGLLPIYCLATSTHYLLTSHASLIARSCGVHPAVAFGRVGAQLARAELRTRETCLEDLVELTPGVLVEFPGGTTTTQMWRCENHLPDGRPLTFRSACDRLRAIATEVVGAWADTLGPVAVAASGGVDSSLICAALADGGRPFACTTLATTDPSGDERPYARLLAESFSAALAEAPYDPARFDAARSASAGLPRPTRRSFLAVVDDMLEGAARQLGAAVTFDGNGGDNLFCYLHSAVPIIDRLRAQGPGSGVWGTVLDMCGVTGCDLPTMARALVGELAGRQGERWPADTRLLGPGSDLGGHSEPLVDWSRTDRGVPRGKREHLAMIMRCQNHVHALSCAPRRFSPLMSQPLLEFCLSVPTWLWAEGGINRAVARTAFAARLPPGIRARSAKSGPDSFIRRAFELRRGAIAEMLMEGLLARHGVIDRVAAERALLVDPFTGGSIIYRLLDLAEAEAWARSWTR